MTKHKPHRMMLGSIAGEALVVDLSSGEVNGDPWAPRKITLTKDYDAANPPGFPDRPPIGLTTKNWKPGIIPAGTTRLFHANEAAALIAAGAAVDTDAVAAAAHAEEAEAAKAVKAAVQVADAAKANAAKADAAAAVPVAPT
jgi:hypothetical protein